MGCIMLVSPCNLHNGLRHCRGKQQGLTLVWNIAQDGFYILAESHVKHLIRLIKRHNLHIVKLHSLPAHMIHHAPRRTNYNLCPRLERLNLAHYLLSAVDRHNLDSVQEFRKFVHFLGHLDRQLPCRAENHCLQCLFLRVNILQNRQPKRRSFSRAGLSLPDNILPGKHHRDGLRLDRCHLLKSHFCHGAQQRTM